MLLTKLSPPQNSCRGIKVCWAHKNKESIKKGKRWYILPFPTFSLSLSLLLLFLYTAIQQIMKSLFQGGHSIMGYFRWKRVITGFAPLPPTSRCPIHWSCSQLGLLSKHQSQQPKASRCLLGLFTAFERRGGYAQQQPQQQQHNATHTHTESEEVKTIRIGPCNHAPGV